MKRYYYISIPLIMLILVVYFSIKYKTNVQKKVELRCSGNVISRRQINDFGIAELHATLFIYLYNDGTGFLTTKGEISVKNNIYTLDREVRFHYSDFDKDGVYTFKFKEMKARIDDRLPASYSAMYPLLGINSPSYYMSVNQVDNGLYTFNEFTTPLFMCKKF